MTKLTKTERNAILEAKPQQWANNIINKTFACKHKFWEYDGMIYNCKQEIAKLYQVPLETVSSCVKSHYEEISGDGIVKIERGNLDRLRLNCNLANKTRHLLAFTPKAVIRIGMLLQKGERPKQIRNSVLENAEENENKKIEQKTKNNEGVISARFSKEEYEYYKKISESKGISISEMSKIAMRKQFGYKNEEEMKINDEDLK